MKLYKQDISIFLGLILLVLAIILKTYIFELLGAILFGIGIALFKDKIKRRKWFTFVIIIVLIAIIFDPVYKNKLDNIFNVNTVSSFKSSILINGSVFLLFLISYFITGKLNRLF